jgi:hypothetical protein
MLDVIAHPRRQVRASNRTSSVLIQLLFMLGIVVSGIPTLHAQTPAPSGSFPRVGNIWWGEYAYANAPSNVANTQLFLGPNFNSGVAPIVAAEDPDTPILYEVNAMETVNGLPSVPSSYYLVDTNGNKICNWPGNPPNYILNLTNPTVAAFVGQYAAQQWAQAGSGYAGIFFDNIETQIANMTTDCYGNSIKISSQANGVADAPAALNAAWQAGIYTVLTTFRAAVPNAYIAIHADQLPPDPRSLAMTNGDIFGFNVPQIREGTLAFGSLWDSYQQWFSSGQQPVIASLQSSPPSQIAYGYGYTPTSTALPQTVTFGQTYYPNMRFGLAMTLMNNGFFIHDFGDVSSPVAWWYDEYNFNLGQPVTPAQLVGTAAGANQITNGGFESGLSPWTFAVTNDGSASATASVDTSNYYSGTASVKIAVASAGTAAYHIDLEQDGLSVTSGTEYTIRFWANASAAENVVLSMQGGAPSYANYGLCTSVEVVPGWNQYSVSFLANTTASDGRLEFWFGNATGNIWLDNVQLTAAPQRLYRRDFTNGVVLLNGTNQSQTFNLESGLSRFSGTQAPKYQYIVDDNSSSFSSTGSWNVDTYDTGSRKASGPYYHAWNSTLHELDSGTGSAQWNLGIPADGSYTLQVWLPAAPNASNWTTQAVYSLVANGTTVATIPLNQSAASAGDQWFNLGTFSLTAASNPTLVVQNGSTGSLIADAVYVFSATARYNDGAAVSQVIVPPMDGILLSRQTANQTLTFASPGNQLLNTTLALNAVTTSGLPATYFSNTPSICTVSGSSASFEAIGTCSISASQAGNSSYTAAVPVTVSFLVQQPQIINLTPTNGTAVVGSGTFTVQASASSGLPVTLASNTATVCTVAGSVVTPVAVGTCSLAGSQTGNTAYAPAPTAYAAFSNVAPQTITFGAIATQALGGAPVALSATASSGLPITFSSLTPTICSVSGTQATLLAMGSCTVEASQGGSTTYAAATPVTQSFTVMPNLITNGGFETSLSPWSFILGSAATGTATAALSTQQVVSGASSVDVDVTAVTSPSYGVDLEQSPLPVHSGTTYTVQFWAKADSSHIMQVELQGGAPSYALYGYFQTFTIGTSWQLYSASFVSPVTATDARLEFHFASSTGNVWLDDVQFFGTSAVPQSITFPAPASLAYGATATLGATTSSGLPVTYSTSTPSVCALTGSQVAALGTGTCTVTASQAGNTAYLAATSVTQPFQIAAAAQTISFPAISNLSYTTTPLTVSATASSGLAVSFSSGTPAVCAVSGSTVTLGAAGVCSIVASQAGNTDYAAASPVTESFTVTPLVQTITFPAVSTQATGAVPVALGATASSGLAVSYQSQTPTVCTVSGATVTPLAAGTCTLTANQTGSSIYAAATAVSTSFTVAANQITNANFSTGALSPWIFAVTADGSAAATATVNSTAWAEGSDSVQIAITSAGTANWHVDLEQDALSIVSGKTYVVEFWANTSVARTIQVATQGGSPSYAAYGLSTLVSLTPGWALYRVTFTAPVTASDCRLEFFMGSYASTVSLDNVQFFAN